MRTPPRHVEAEWPIREPDMARRLSEAQELNAAPASVLGESSVLMFLRV